MSRRCCGSGPWSALAVMIDAFDAECPTYGPMNSELTVKFHRLGVQTFRQHVPDKCAGALGSGAPGLERPTAEIAELGESVARTSSGMSYSPRRPSPRSFRDPVLLKMSDVYNVAPLPGPQTRPSSWSTRMTRDLVEDSAWEPLRSYALQCEADKPPNVLSPRGCAFGWPEKVLPGSWRQSLDRDDWLSTRSTARCAPPHCSSADAAKR
eukprot:SAG31_NODE_1505_length_8078_cov_5.291390_8_plen_209_part_00